MSLEPETVLAEMEKADELYHRLVLVVAPSGAGKTAALQSVAKQRAVPCTNVNLELSKRMLDLTAQQRAIHAAELLREIVERSNGDAAVLDNLEVLFDRSLHLDPLRVLKDLGRQTTVVASWNGRIDDHGLTYGDPDHPEYRLYPPSDLDFLHVTTEKEQG
jgi:ABC-type uncharacterized transport system ATPase component